MKDSTDHPNLNWQDFAEQAAFRDWVNDSTPENKAYWEKQITESPEQKAMIGEARAFLLAVKTKHGGELLTVEELAADRKAIERKLAHRKLMRNRRRQWLSAAAAMLLLALGVFALWPKATTASGPEQLVFRTGNGETRTINLPDGSEVSLNGNSTLAFVDNWMPGADREVTLSGEAFFSVTSQPSTGAKFTVLTQDLAVEVLGTRFNVNTYLEKTEVVLNEGKVQLRFPEQPTRTAAPLQPGERIRFATKTGELLRGTVDTLAYSGWKDGLFVFDDTPLGEITDKLAAIYGVDFQFMNADLRQIEVSTTASADNLDEFLRVLRLLFTTDGIEINRDGNSIQVIQNKAPM